MRRRSGGCSCPSSLASPFCRRLRCRTTRDRRSCRIALRRKGVENTQESPRWSAASLRSTETAFGFCCGFGAFISSSRAATRDLSSTNQRTCIAVMYGVAFRPFTRPPAQVHSVNKRLPARSRLLQTGASKSRRRPRNSAATKLYHNKCPPLPPASWLNVSKN